jgi:hypothetical protein
LVGREVLDVNERKEITIKYGFENYELNLN